MHELSDTELIHLARSGNRDAFGVLFDRYLSKAQRVAYGLVHDRAIAEDLAQEAMLQAYLSLSKLNDPRRFASWLHGIVRNLAHSYLRRQKKGMTISVDELDEWRVDRELPNSGRGSSGDPVQFTERRMAQQTIEKAMEALAPKRKEAAVLFYLSQMSIREIAQQLTISETAVKSRLFQARKQLQTQLALLLPRSDGPVHSGTCTYERKPLMIKIDSVHTFTRDDNHAILLFVAKESMRCLQMWIGTDMGYALAQILKGEEMPRPLTHNTMAKMAELLNAKVTRVEVAAIKETTFIGTIYLDVGGVSKELDARPSDAVPLALVTGAPIFVADDVLEKSGRDLPDPFDEDEWLEATKQNHQERAQLLQKWQDALSADGSTFTFRARNACTVMMAEAEQYGHNYLGTEHLLLGLAAEQEGVAGRVLAKLGVTYDALEQLVTEKVGKAEHRAAGLPTLAPRLTKVFELAEAQRSTLGHRFIGSEHLLLGLLAEPATEDSDGQGMAAQFLNDLNVSFDAVRAQVMAVFAGEGR